MRKGIFSARRKTAACTALRCGARRICPCPGQYEYIQQLEYAVTIDAETGEVIYIATIRESTMGYSVDRDLFLGKTAEEIAGLTDEQIKAGYRHGRDDYDRFRARYDRQMLRCVCGGEQWIERK